MTELESRPLEIGYDRDAGVSDRLLWSRLSRATSREEFAAIWLQLQARMLKEVRVGVLILGKAESGPFMPAAMFPPKAAVSPDLSVAAETALAERKGTVCDRPAGERSEASQCIALPILIDGELHGVAAFDLVPRSAEALAEAGRRLQWGAAWVEVLIRRQTLLPNGQLVEIMDVVAAVMEAPSLSVAVKGLSVELARVLKAEWAACGLVRRGRMSHVEALSQTVATSRKPGLIGAAETAMQEAFDQRGLVQLPEDREAFRVVTRAHKLLAEAAGGGGLVSVPIARGDTILGILTVVARAGAEFSAGDRDFCRLLASMVGPAIELKQRDDRWIGAKLGASLQDLLARLIGPRHTLLKLGAVLLVAAAAYLSLGTATWRVTAQATIEGSVQRAVAAPIAGYIAAQGPRAGDSVAKGEVLARLDDREFQVEAGALAVRARAAAARIPAGLRRWRPLARPGAQGRDRAVAVAYRSARPADRARRASGTDRRRHRARRSLADDRRAGAARRRAVRDRAARRLSRHPEGRRARRRGCPAEGRTAS